MRSCKEIRQEAWGIVMNTTWPRKILCNTFVLYLLVFGVAITISIIYDKAGIQTWESFREAQQAAQRAGLTLTVPSTVEACRMTCASLCSWFIRQIVQGIFAFGIATTLVKCVRNDSMNWFSAAFGGFKRPFGLLWLTTLVGLKVMLWALLFIIPGIIAAIRYALAMYIKAENPEMGAGDCIKRSCEIMDGRKMKYAQLMLSYIGWTILALSPLFVVGVICAAGGKSESISIAKGVTMGIGFIATFALLIFTSIYAAIGMAIFYRDAKAELYGPRDNFTV